MGTTSSPADPQMRWNLNARVPRERGALARDGSQWELYADKPVFSDHPHEQYRRLISSMYYVQDFDIIYSKNLTRISDDIHDFIISKNGWNVKSDETRKKTALSYQLFWLSFKLYPATF